MDSKYLNETINDHVKITTSGRTLIQTRAGELIEIPHIIEGMLIDYDELFLIVVQNNQDRLTKIARGKVVTIEPYEPQQPVEPEADEDDEPPKKKDIH